MANSTYTLVSGCPPKNCRATRAAKPLAERTPGRRMSRSVARITHGMKGKTLVKGQGMPGHHEQPEGEDQSAEKGPGYAHLQSPSQEVRAHCGNHDFEHSDQAQRPPERQDVGGDAERGENGRLHVGQIRGAPHDVGVPQGYVRELGGRVLQERFEQGDAIDELPVGPDDQRMLSDRRHTAGYRCVPRCRVPQVVGGRHRVTRKEPGPEENHCEHHVRTENKKRRSGQGPLEQRRPIVPCHPHQAQKLPARSLQ